MGNAAVLVCGLLGPCDGEHGPWCNGCAKELDDSHLELGQKRGCDWSPSRKASFIYLPQCQGSPDLSTYLFGGSEQEAGLHLAFNALKLQPMSVQEIKEQLAALPRNEQDEVIAYLFHLRHAHDREYESQTGRRLKDKDPSHWLSPDAFERELDKKETP